MILVRFNNDAPACFDRIMPHIFYLYLQFYQIPLEFTALLGDLLLYAKYAIKIANVWSWKLIVTQKTNQYMDPDKAVQHQQLRGTN